MSGPSLLDRLSPAAGPLRLGGIAATALADRYGTPLFVYDAAILRAQAQAVQAAFGPRVRVLFALKANPCVAVARVLRAAGTGAEVASAGELLVARAAGFAPADVQFAGPAKSDADLDLALDLGLGSINLESEAEYEHVARAAAERSLRPGVAIRVNPAHTSGGSRMRMGGGSQKFGVDAEAVPALAARIAREDRCALRGLHVYTGSQNTNADGWLATARELVQLADRVEAATGVPLTSLDFGGGFAVPTFQADAPFDLDAAGRGLRALIAAAPPGRHHFVEPGRFLCAEAGVYLTRVRHTKASQGRTHALLDGGMHHFGAACGLGAIIRRPYPIVACRDPRATADATFALGGPLCTPADEFGAEVPLPHLAAGDLLAVLLAGAYGLSFSPTAFLGHPTPAEVLVDAGSATLVRERGRAEDALRGQVLP